MKNYKEAKVIAKHSLSGALAVFEIAEENKTYENTLFVKDMGDYFHCMQQRDGTQWGFSLKKENVISIEYANNQKSLKQALDEAQTAFLEKEIKKFDLSVFKNTMNQIKGNNNETTRL